MSDDKSETVESLDGWSIVRHRDDVGSDADSVEVISDESDRDTCDEGKETYDDEHKDESAESTKNESVAESGEEEIDGPEEGDLDTDLVNWDPLKNLTTRMFTKLQDYLLVPTQTQQEIKLYYVIIASILLALISCLLASSYILFHKFQELPGKRDDSSSVQVVQELEQAISRLQSVLRLENEQHLQEILSKMPSDKVLPESNVAGSEINIKRSTKSSNGVNEFTKEDFGIVTNAKNTEGIADDIQVGSAEHLQSTDSLHYGFEKTQSQEEKYKKNTMDQINSFDKILKNIPLNFKLTNEEEVVSNGEALHSDSSLPTQGSKDDDNFESDNHIKDSDSNTNSVLSSVSEDILSLQNLLYSQIMNSLFEYKIDLYKNLMRAGLDSTCNADHSSKKNNHKKFMLIRNLQNMIAKSSESNFESWYTFYSYSMSPRFRSILEKLSSIVKNQRGGTKSPLEDGIVIDNVKASKESADSDDFFVRSSVPLGGSDYETIHASAKDGFDWKNLNKKIRENIEKARSARKYQPLAENKDNVNAHKSYEENKINSNAESSLENNEFYQNNMNADIIKTSQKQQNQRIYNSERGTSAKSEKTKEVKKNAKDQSEEWKRAKDQSEERKRAKDQSEEWKREASNNKNKKSINVEDFNNNDHSEFNKQDKKKNFEKHKSRESNNFEKSKDSGDHLGKGKARYEHEGVNNGKSKEHFDENDCSGGRFGKRDEQDYYFHDGKHRRKSFFNNMSKYFKKAASGIWKTVRGGFKKVKNYGSFIKNWHTGKNKGKGNYEEWRKEFMKEMKDVFRVLGGNPTINGLYELPKSVTKFFGDGWENIVNTEHNMDKDSEGSGPEGIELDECTPNEGGDEVGSYSTCSSDDSEDDTDSSSDSDNEDDSNSASWYMQAAKHRAKTRADQSSTDPSWFLGLGRHRSYLRRRGIHLEDDGSWFISSARHRAKMRQRHVDSAQFSSNTEQASSKR